MRLDGKTRAMLLMTHTHVTNVYTFLEAVPEQQLREKKRRVMSHGHVFFFSAILKGVSRVLEIPNGGTATITRASGRGWRI